MCKLFLDCIHHRCTIRAFSTPKWPRLSAKSGWSTTMIAPVLSVRSSPFVAPASLMTGMAWSSPCVPLDVAHEITAPSPRWRAVYQPHDAEAAHLIIHGCHQCGAFPILILKSRVMCASCTFNL